MKFLYVVKSRRQSYATFGEPFPGRLLPDLDWTYERKNAVHYTTREAAQFLANLCQGAEGRVVRVRVKR